MTCASCGQDNRANARFCDGCGAPLALRCPACGTELRPGARFCDGCGRAVAGAPDAAPAAPSVPAPPGPSTEGRAPALRPAGAGQGPDPGDGRPAGGSSPRAPSSYTPRHLADRILTEGRALRGERKEVTVLFVDVQGSTELAGHLDPEEFHAVMDGAFQVMLDAVHRWEGTVNQFTGDGVMALFGAPLAHEDHARRACHVALEIQRGFAEYAARLRRDKGLSFQARLGLNSGPVVVGAIGDDLRMDYTAQGLTTNLSARMQQAADPGSILVAEPTYRLAEGYFRFRALGPLRVRGMAEPVEAYALEGEGSAVSRLEASLRRGASPFRGREAELAALAECWDHVLRGRGQAVCLAGEPGIGKSRLAWELQRSLGLAERVEAAAVAHARGGPPSTSSASSCAAWPASSPPVTSPRPETLSTGGCGTWRPSWRRGLPTSSPCSAPGASPRPREGAARTSGRTGCAGRWSPGSRRSAGGALACSSSRTSSGSTRPRRSCSPTWRSKRRACRSCC